MKNFIHALLGLRIKTTVYLKSGQTIVLWGDNVKATLDHDTGNFSKFSMNSIANAQLIMIPLPQTAAVISRQYLFRYFV